MLDLHSIHDYRELFGWPVAVVFRADSQQIGRSTLMAAPTLENKELKNVYVLWSQPIINTDSGWATVFLFDFVIWFAPNRNMFKEKQAWRRYGRYAIFRNSGAYM